MTDNHADLDAFFTKFLDKGTENPMFYGEKIAKIGTDQVKERLLNIVKEDDVENAYLAMKALALCPEKNDVLGELMEEIHKPSKRDSNGGLVSLLDEFDLSDRFVDLFRIYLFGNFKASALAKNYLDTLEFDITPRTLKKAEKHWNHFLNNSSNDDAFELKKAEGQEIIQEIDDLFGD